MTYSRRPCARRRKRSHPRGDAGRIDRLLDKHRRLARQLQRIVDLLKPQQRRRVRYQYEGDELDLDVAIRAAIDYRIGSTPDTRIHQSHIRDGHDIDVQDPKYLQDDTRVAVTELDSKGITTYCISLDPHADDYVADIFGRNNYTVIDRVERLPEKLPQLFMRLTR